MAVEFEDGPIKDFDLWYVDRKVDPRNGCIETRGGLSDQATRLIRRYDYFKREMDARCADYEKLVLLADGEVISPKPDLPNVSSGETAGIIRRIARNLVQHTPNVEIINQFDDDSPKGIIARHILLTKIIGSDLYSNDMQQNLFASTKLSLTTGFDCVIPVLLQQADGTWYTKYDTIHYRDVFPEPGTKDVRQATEVFVRRYLTKGEVKALIQNQVRGWDLAALRDLLHTNPKPPHREPQSNSTQDTKRRVLAEGYEIITWYSSSGRPFLTWSANTKNLLRIEVNKHPAKMHPVFFLVLEKDSQQPLGKSQVELLLGRQEFQDLMHNGAMKMWYRNINPPLIGFGALNTTPNLSPGKYTSVSNPNARIEPFEVQTQTLMQYQVISQGNTGAMVNLVGSADQQMAMQAGNGMSATPQGVEAQQGMVDITTNNYQKAIESFFSHYCSYALTMYFQELKGTKRITPTADARQALVGAGLDAELFNDEGDLDVSFSDMAVQYFVRCVPGSLVELEDEKQLRILQQIFVPLSQAMPALAASNDPELLKNMAATMQFIVQRTIELSGSNRSNDLRSLVTTGRTDQDDKLFGLEEQINGLSATVETTASLVTSVVAAQQQMSMLAETQGLILQALGAGNGQSAPQSNNPAEQPQQPQQ